MTSGCRYRGTRHSLVTSAEFAVQFLPIFLGQIGAPCLPGVGIRNTSEHFLDPVTNISHRRHLDTFVESVRDVGAAYVYVKSEN